jgi:hypothetical protein
MNQTPTRAQASTLCTALVAATLSLASLNAQASCPSWPTAERFAISGEEVTDKRTGLIWKRCSEGQIWSGSSCTGTAAIYTHQGALQHAQAQSGWRLPNVKELASLAEKGCPIPAIDRTAFPGTPNNWYWSSSPYVGNSGGAWVVGFSNGGVGYNFRYDGLHVRLVRASQ